MRKKILSFGLYFYFSMFSSVVIAQKWLWGKFGIGDAFPSSVATDKFGNCYFSGLFPYDTLNFGGFTLPNSAYYNNVDNIFLVKYAPDGNVVWVKQAINKVTSNRAVTSLPCTVATDGSGNIYMNGNFPDTLIIGTYTLIVNAPLRAFPWSDATFLAKYDSNGNVIWAKQSFFVNSNGDIGGKAISSDLQGNTYVTGAFGDTIKFGSETISSPSNIVEAFLVKYDSKGNVKWTRQSTSHTNYGVTAYAVISSKDGSSVITGYFEDSAFFGSYKLWSSFLSQSDGSFFITKYDSIGNVLWAKQSVISDVFSGADGWALTTDQSGNIYVAGDFVGTVVFSNDTLNNIQQANPNQGSFFLLKYDQNGNILWAKQANVLDSNGWYAWNLSIDNSKHLYLSADGGFGNCKITFGGDTLSVNDTAKYDGVSVIFKLDSNGKSLCSSIISVAGRGDNPNFITSDTSGKYVYFGGDASTVVIFGMDTINPFQYPVYARFGLNYFPFVARWEACDSEIFIGINQKENASGQVILYPNPNNGVFNIAMQNVNQSSQVIIYNVLGESIYQTRILSNNAEINIVNQPNGVYFYRVISKRGELVGEGKVVIEK